MGLFTSQGVPGADHLEHVRVGDDDALLAVGRAPAAAPGATFTGQARLEMCKPQEVLADLVMVLPDREVSPPDRRRLLAMAASIRRRPVSDVPSEQCIEKEVPAACSTACEQGHAESCVKLGYLTDHGVGGLAPDRAAALRLFERGCAAGSAKGCRALQILRSR